MVEKTTAENIEDILIEGVQVQIAATKAGIAFWKGWIKNASEFTDEVDKEIMKVHKSKKKGIKERIKVAQFSDAAKKLLRKTTELPNVAATEFNNELGKRMKKKSKPTRSAKVKP